MVMNIEKWDDTDMMLTLDAEFSQSATDGHVPGEAAFDGPMAADIASTEMDGWRTGDVWDGRSWPVCAGDDDDDWEEDDDEDDDYFEDDEDEDDEFFPDDDDFEDDDYEEEDDEA
ncbi:MAG: hypothetical protein J5J06_12530 [Phycisphaerae bacterium]|nr:hypothetical protein [Phycisphaerae bacterium]